VPVVLVSLLWWLTEGMPVHVNGLDHSAVLTAVTGSTERWRLISAISPDELYLSLLPATGSSDSPCSSWNRLATGVQFVEYARDGIVMTQYYRTNSLFFSPGYRIELFVKFTAAAGTTYCLVGTRPKDLQGTSMLTVKLRSPNSGESTYDIPDEGTVGGYAHPVEWEGSVMGIDPLTGPNGVSRVHVSCQNAAAWNVAHTPAGAPLSPEHLLVGLLMTPVAQSGTSLVTDGGACIPVANNTVKAEPDGCYCPAPNIGCRYDYADALCVCIGPVHPFSSPPLPYGSVADAGTCVRGRVLGACALWWSAGTLRFGVRGVMRQTPFR
jgi:hypothetical protein